MVDINAQLDAVDRAVTSEERDGETVRVQTLAQTYPAPIDDVWDALTSAERIPRWFMPVSGELRLGGRYQLEGNAGGTVESCDAPNAFRVTWEYGGGVTWLNVRLTEIAGDRTRVQLEHTARAGDIGGDEMWEQFGPSATGIGWDQTILGLSEHLAGGSLTPEGGAEWVASEEGLQFMRGSADRWALAHAASGTEPEAARKAADTTYAAYTGAEPAPHMD